MLQLRDPAADRAGGAEEGEVRPRQGGAPPDDGAPRHLQPHQVRGRAGERTPGRCRRHSQTGGCVWITGQVKIGERSVKNASW